MIPTQDEIKTAITAALRLARGETAALELFDFSFDGFWKSFFAAVLVLPLYLIALFDRHSQDGEEIGTGRLFAVEGLTYILGWVLFPVIAIFIARALNRSQRYVPLIVVNNWGSVPQSALLVLAILIGRFFPAETGVMGFLMLITFAVTLIYQWYLIRISLEVSGFISFAILLFYLVLNFSLNMTGEGFLQPA